jgi:hypothetical protein
MNVTTVFRTLRAVSIPLLNGVVSLFVALSAQAERQSTATPVSEVIGNDFSCRSDTQSPVVECSTLTEEGLSELQYFTLEQPDRLVIDLPHRKIRRHEMITVGNSPIVQRIRTGQRLDTARVVFDLRNPVSLSQRTSTDKRTVSFRLDPLSTAPPPLPVLPSPTPQEARENAERDDGEVSPEREPAVSQEKLTVIVPKSSESAARERTISLPREQIEPDHILKFSVDSTFISFEPGERPVRDVRVINKTDREIFLRTDVQRVFDSGAPEERFENTKTMLSTPRRFLLPPLGSRAVRLVLAGQPPSEGEEMYRLIISPERMPDTAVEVAGAVDDYPATFSVIAGIGVTVSLPSAEARGIVKVESGINQVVLTNYGARTVLVENCSSCPLAKDVCTSTERKLLYPNTPWSIPVVGSGVLNCDLRTGRDTQKLSTTYGAKKP